MAPKRSPLRQQLAWLIRLRWVAGATVIVLSLLDWRWLGWHDDAPLMIGVGGAILIYNALLALTMRRGHDRRDKRLPLLASAWWQILLDLGGLTLLTVWTGGIESPLIGFYVFHMVFASLMLPRMMAFGGAAVAVMMLLGGLHLAGQWPDTLHHRLMLGGWVLTLLLTVHLTSRITRGLRAQRRRLIRQNRRIRAMTGRLRKQQRMLIQHEKMSAMGQMAAGIAHEIANPLASMDSVLQLMQRRPERPRPDSVQTLRTQVERIRNTIQQMSTFAHPGGGDRQTVRADVLIEQAIDLVRFDHRIRNVELVRQFGDDPPAVRVSPQSIHQVLINLLLNALDAMEGRSAPGSFPGSSGPRITVGTERDGPWAVLWIEDNGHGIEPAHVARLFEPFFTTKPLGKGTGLGLSISYTLVRSHDGEIRVTSTPNQSTRFNIRLPFAP
jgi:signal transduction histidine kinase